MRPLTMRGEVAVEDLSQALAQYTPGYIDGRSSWFIDFRNAELKLSDSDAMLLSDQIERYRRASVHADTPCRIAILVDDDFNYGISRIMQGYIESSEVKVQVARSEQDAQSWLGEDVARSDLI